MLLRVLRIVLLVVIALLLVAVVAVGVGSDDTGVAEKAVLVIAGLLLLLAASRVRRLGAGPRTSAPR
jgi:hypothetical protein